MLGTASINTIFVSLSRGDTAMPGGLHARLCHAFLVCSVLAGKIVVEILFIYLFNN